MVLARESIFRLSYFSGFFLFVVVLTTFDLSGLGDPASSYATAGLALRRLICLRIKESVVLL
jgi:hypothetical protein